MRPLLFAFPPHAAAYGIYAPPWGIRGAFGFTPSRSTPSSCGWWLHINRTAFRRHFSSIRAVLWKKRKEVAITGLGQNTGVEPALSAWKADVLSTNTSSAHAPVFPGCHAVAFGSCRSLDSNQMSRLLRVGGPHSPGDNGLYTAGFVLSPPFFGFMPLFSHSFFTASPISSDFQIFSDKFLTKLPSS